MAATSTVRFFEGRTYTQIMTNIDHFCNTYPLWEITSVSHMMLPNGVLSAACSLRYKGSNNAAQEATEQAIELPSTKVTVAK